MNAKDLLNYIAADFKDGIDAGSAVTHVEDISFDTDEWRQPDDPRPRKQQHVICVEFSDGAMFAIEVKDLND